MQTLIEDILKSCPGPVISRKEAAKLTGGLISEKYLANLDCNGEGPNERVNVGRRVGYKSESFAHWLAARINQKKY